MDYIDMMMRNSPAGEGTLAFQPDHNNTGRNNQQKTGRETIFRPVISL